ncbi:uncharacterized protein LOC108699357 isoform X3 [Xenopus laevis]|uniref:Uncharacterized protein LOC108699357 isoform X3 n=1 Tax=Xenopus laevis TaxID=8355 RepID=A0A8J1LJE9_XENLA|nr:uncharacterized protein LOC108699357 isoform X3 [Xenopus laevis]
MAFPTFEPTTSESYYCAHSPYLGIRSLFELQRQLELQRQIVLQRQLERKRLFAELFGKDSVDNYPPLILSRRALPEGRQLGDSNKTLSVPSKDTGWGDPLNPDRKQIINSSKGKAEICGGIWKPTHQKEENSEICGGIWKPTHQKEENSEICGGIWKPTHQKEENSEICGGIWKPTHQKEENWDRNIEYNQGFTDQAEEKSQQTITKRKFTKFSMKSQFKDTNVIINKLKDFFFLMNEITWILCVLIATSQVVVAETALTKTLSVPVSSDIELCGLTCETSGMYTLDREFGVPILDYFCPEKSINFHDWNRERLQVNVSTGCCIIKNALKSDTGNYELMFQGTKKEIWVQKTSCLVIDPISACIITTEYSDSGETYLRVFYSGEEATVLWTWNGGALPERHQLSDSNKTLTVPSTDTGTFTVLVSNPVSHTSTHYNLTLPESRSRLRIGLCAALSIVTGMAIIALKGPARYKFERMKQNNTANKNSATADNLVSQDSFMVSDDVSFKEKAEMCV